MKQPHLVVSLLLLLFAVAIGIESWQLSYMTAIGPGPGFFPLWLSGMLAVLSVVLMAKSARAPAAPLPAGFVPDRAGVFRIGLVAAAMIGAVLLLDRAGFRLTMLAMYAVILFGFGRRDPLLIAAVSFAGSFGAYHVFTDLLDVPLPLGPFGW